MNRRSFFEMAAGLLASLGLPKLFLPRRIWKADNPTVVQTIRITGEPTGGVFTITYQGETTGDIAYNASQSEIHAELNKLVSH